MVRTTAFLLMRRRKVVRKNFVGLLSPSGHFHDTRLRLARCGLGAMVVCGLDASEREARMKRVSCSLTPGELAKRSLAQFDAKVARLDGIAAAWLLSIESPYAQISIDRDGVVKAEHRHGVAKFMRTAEDTVCEHDFAAHAVFDGAADHVVSQFHLGLEHDRVRDTRSAATLQITGPRLGIQIHLNGHLLAGARDGQADSELAIGDPAGTARVLIDGVAKYEHSLIRARTRAALIG
jgi:hypothetical protein